MAGSAALLRRVLDDCVRAWEDKGLVPVLVSHQVRRLAVRTSDLDDLRKVLSLTYRAAVNMQTISYLCTHGVLRPVIVLSCQPALSPRSGGGWGPTTKPTR